MCNLGFHGALRVIWGDAGLGDVLRGLWGVKGLYVLLLDCEGGFYRVGRFFEGDMPPGRYVYVGSAWGSGGLGSRLLRHLRRDKRLRWHIDWLTVDPRVKLRVVYVFPGEKDESRLACRLGRVGDCIIQGFGASDDRACNCHLYRLNVGVNVLEGLLRDFFPLYRKIVL